MLSLEFRGATRRRFADDLQEPFGGSKKDVLLDQCGSSRLKDTI
ncbi:MAG: hypothetical protein NTZ03_13150 [Actinobacteria bacterium]|nr:hypothetical protein [Actinomycetota bacterium]